MESPNLDAFTSELQRQRNVMHEKATALRSDLITVETDLARIDAALVALSGEGTKAASNGLASKRPKRTCQTPSAKKADVIATMRRVLERSGELHEDALRKEVEAELAKAGFNRAGLAMRFSEALQESHVVATPVGFKLAENDTTVSPETSRARALCNSLTKPPSRAEEQKTTPDAQCVLQVQKRPL